MEDTDKDQCFKIILLGNSNVGKTAIINRLVNKYFPNIYEPTMEVENYAVKLNLNEDDVVQKTYINLILQDTFGLNNPLLNKQPELINSSMLREKRDAMAKAFKEIMFSSNDKRNKISNNAKKVEITGEKKVLVREAIFSDDPKYESESTIQRLGFIFVCDCENPQSVESVFHVINKLQEIEKTNNLVYPKCIFFNKVDKVNEKVFKESMKPFTSQFETYKNKFKIDFPRVSALTGQGLIEAFRKFLSKIHQQEEDNKQNQGVKEQDEDDDSKEFKPQCVDKMNSCSRSVFCGARIFRCGERSEEEDEDN